MVSAQEAKSRSRDVICREAQMREHVLTRGRSPKAFHTNHRTLVARPAMPAHR